MNRLLSHGYFPTELPYLFSSRSFASFVHRNPPTSAPFTFNPAKGPTYASRPVLYNLARAGGLRRVLSIPNPVNYFQQSEVFTANWPTLKAHYAKAQQSLSRPLRILSATQKRAFEWSSKLSDLPERRARSRLGMRYAVRTDIQGCYPSIYTHSIPWALHTKTVAQANTAYSASVGNQLDALIQRAQSRQTKGIPIGPDTSFLAAEAILTSLDLLLIDAVGKRYFRYVDDYEFSYRSFTDAESGLSAFQEILSAYELSANESKTRIFELPAPLDQDWPRQLRPFNVSNSAKPRTQRSDLINLFDLSLDLRAKYPGEGVIKFVVRMATCYVAIENWSLYQRLLCQWAQVEPQVLPLVLDILFAYKTAGYVLELNELDELLFTIVSVHAARGHTSEIAWAIWGHLLFNLKLQDGALKEVVRMDNSIVALLTLNARAEGLVPRATTFPTWAAHMSLDALSSEHWLLAYEGRVNKWLPPVGKEYIRTAPGFSELASGNVSFLLKDFHKKYIPLDRYLLPLKFALIRANSTDKASEEEGSGY